MNRASSFKVVGLLSVLILAGCTEFSDHFTTKMKCVGGIVYIQLDGAWVQALAYKDNKCLPEEK